MYRTVRVTILEMMGFDEAVVRPAGSEGLLAVRQSELVPLLKTDELLATSDLMQIPEDVWAIAEARATEVKAIHALPSGQRNAVMEAAKRLGLSVRHMWRLVKEYGQHLSVRGFLPGQRGRKAGARVLDVEVERIIDQGVREFYLQPHRPSIKALVDHVASECIAQGLSPPTRSTIQRRLKATEERSQQVKRVGAKRARYRFEPMPGHVTALAPLERVEIDHTLLDVMLRSDDPDSDFVGRPWLTLAIDVATRCILGLYITFDSPSALSNAICMTCAVLPKDLKAEYGLQEDWPMHGVPKLIMTDNGKDFQSEAFRRGCMDYGIELQYRPVGSPHYGGTIERLIGTMVGLCHMLPGTTKRNVVAKDAYDSQKHALLTLSDFRRWFVEQVIAYHLTPHRSLRVPPGVAWERGDGGESC
jgi:putative transposase